MIRTYFDRMDLWMLMRMIPMENVCGYFCLQNLAVISQFLQRYKQFIFYTFSIITCWLEFTSQIISVRPFMTFTNRIGEDIYIKLNSDDEPKVLNAYDSRVSFVFQPSGRDELQVSCLCCRIFLIFIPLIFVLVNELQNCERKKWIRLLFRMSTGACSMICSQSNQWHFLKWAVN